MEGRRKWAPCYLLFYGNVLKWLKRLVCKTSISAVRICPLPPIFTAWGRIKVDSNRRGVMLLVCGIALLGILALFIFVFASGGSKASSGSKSVATGLNNYSSSTYSNYDGEIYTGMQLRQFIDSAIGKDSVILVHTHAMELDKVITAKNDRYIQIFNRVPYVNFGKILSVSDTTDIEETILVYTGERAPDIDDTLVLGKRYIESPGRVCTDAYNKPIMNETIGDFRWENTVEYVSDFAQFETKVIADCEGKPVGVMFTQIKKE